MLSLGDLQQALRLIDAANAADPTHQAAAYAERMTRRLASYRTEASELLQIAARAQHIERWTLPRDTYPAGRSGYLRWRTALAAHHAERAGELMRQASFGESDVDVVARLLRKEGLADATPDADVQVLEDVACLVFVEHYLEGFAAGRAPAKVRQILEKTLAKMSPRAREVASTLRSLGKLPARWGEQARQR